MALNPISMPLIFVGQLEGGSIERVVVSICSAMGLVET
jgi:hypothetical protein